MTECIWAEHASLRAEFTHMRTSAPLTQWTKCDARMWRVISVPLLWLFRRYVLRRPGPFPTDKATILRASALFAIPIKAGSVRTPKCTRGIRRKRHIAAGDRATKG